MLRSALICPLSATRGSPKPVQRRPWPEGGRVGSVTGRGWDPRVRDSPRQATALRGHRPRAPAGEQSQARRVVVMGVTILGATPPPLGPYHRWRGQNVLLLARPSCCLSGQPGGVRGCGTLSPAATVPARSKIESGSWERGWSQLEGGPWGQGRQPSRPAPAEIRATAVASGTLGQLKPFLPP